MAKGPLLAERQDTFHRNPALGVGGTRMGHCIEGAHIAGRTISASDCGSAFEDPCLNQMRLRLHRKAKKGPALAMAPCRAWASGRPGKFPGTRQPASHAAFPLGLGLFWQSTQDKPRLRRGHSLRPMDLIRLSNQMSIFSNQIKSFIGHSDRII